MSCFPGDFPRAWSLLLEHIESSALCPNAEVSLAALKSFQEILHVKHDTDEELRQTNGTSKPMVPPSEEVISRSGETIAGTGISKDLDMNSGEDSDIDISLWATAWRVWLNIGANVTKPPDQTSEDKVYVPPQPFLTALIQTFPPLFHRIQSRFVAADLSKFSGVLKGALSVPVHGEVSPFIIPTYPEITVTPLQEATLQAMETVIKVSPTPCKSCSKSIGPFVHPPLTGFPLLKCHICLETILLSTLLT